MSFIRTTYNGCGVQVDGNFCFDEEYFGDSYFLSGTALMTQGFIYKIADAWQSWDNENIEDVSWQSCDCDIVCE